MRDETMPSDATVWVVQEGRNDYTPAEKYGTVRFITDCDIGPIHNSKWNSLCKRDIADFASRYIPGKDYVVLTGNPVVCAHVVRSLPRGTNKFLKWDSRSSMYYLFTEEMK